MVCDWIYFLDHFYIGIFFESLNFFWIILERDNVVPNYPIDILAGEQSQPTQEDNNENGLTDFDQLGEHPNHDVNDLNPSFLR